MTETAAGPLLHFRWDLDKTYLHTEFDSLRDLWRTFRQKPEDKRNVAGARTLLRALLEPESGDETPRHVTFISGSPRQMRKVLTEKLRSDGIEPNTFILKPNLSNILRGRFRSVNDQVGYKLGALLDSRVDGGEVREFLFGDDAEADALIYSLYADLISGAVDADRFAAILTGTHLYRDEIEQLLQRTEALRNIDTSRVDRIFIRLDRRSPTARFDAFGSRVVATYNYFQAAVVLFADERLTDRALANVTASMQSEGYTPIRLANSLQDLVRRGVLATEAVDAVRDAMAAGDAIGAPMVDRYVNAFTAALGNVESAERPARQPAEQIDYETLLAQVARYRRPMRRALRAGPLRDD